MTPSNHRTRPSISSWLSRSSLLSPNAPTSATAEPRRTINISDPIPEDRSSRMGPLGQGATPVSTPQEALSRSCALHLPSDILEEESEADSHSNRSRVETRRRSLAPSTTSSQDRRSSYSRSLPSIPPSPSRRAYSRPTTPPPPVPPLPVEVFLPSFNPILLEFHPENILEWSQTIVTLETSTETYRTTWSTLMAYPSNLSRYLESLLLGQQTQENPQPEESKGSQAHLGAHIFLDRPSVSYAHILQYMRTPTATPTTLPWAIQLEASTSARLEALLALRDEAKYLDLDLLYRLCCIELGIEGSQSPKSVSFPPIEETQRENFHQWKRVSVATTAVDSPTLPISSIILDDYFPSAAVLKSRTRSNSRSSKAPPIPPPMAQSGWI